MGKRFKIRLPTRCSGTDRWEEAFKDVAAENVKRDRREPKMSTPGGPRM
jgi:hypothetical protein